MQAPRAHVYRSQLFSLWIPREPADVIRVLSRVVREGAGSGPPSETLRLVGPPGLEPGSAGYEPGALPLSYGPHGIIA